MIEKSNTQKRVKTLLWLLASIAIFAAWNTEACHVRPNEAVPTLITPLNFSTEQKLFAYHADLLQLVIDKTTAEFGPCKLTVIETNRPLNRIHLHIDGGELFDTVDSTVNPSRDKKLLPIRFPIYRGFMGYRVMIIREGEQARFDGIHTLKDMQSFTLGAGANWFDRKLVQRENIHTVIGDDLRALYRMLPAGRFDAILRGVQEVKIDELRVHPSGHALEKHLVIAYPLPVNFYVRKIHTTLAQRINRGLELSLADGSFMVFFNQHPLIKEAVARAQLEKRNFLYLCNPELSSETPLDKPRYWYKPWPQTIINCSSNAGR